MTIDLRSDTVTQPTPEMRRAMAEAEVGDDVFEEDPTVQRLEARVAGLLGHEAALFVSSGSMGNGVAVRTHCAAGDEVVAEYDSHVFNNEVGSTAALSGAQVHPLRGEGGILTAAQIESTIRSEDVHHSDTRLVCIENTHNFAGGAVYPVETLREISALCAGRGIGRHLDGARLWNASAETGISLDTYARLFDSVSVCLSKGLGAPVGSVLVGSRHFIHRARR
ncbi:MAG: low specificity L-threonine aldolase, partial [Armatimonadetes bacterium]|nr:low specificity L-threonine aldolase [Armatimonadota bacterium]